MSDEESGGIVKTITVDDFDKICRLCLSEEDVTCLSGSIFEDITAADLLQFCFSTKVNESDIMPQNICSDCLAELSRMYGFKKQCVENEAILEALVKQKRENVSDSEILKIEMIYDEEDGDKSPKVTTSRAQNDSVDAKNGQVKRHSFNCGSCQAQFPTLQDVTEHKRKMKHAEYRLVKCEYCEKAVTCKMMSVHLQSHGEKKFECDICHRRFAIRNNMNRHKKKHTNDRPFVCEKCGKRFIQRVTLLAHTKVHERQALGDVVFSCRYCERSFSRACRLANHMRAHTKLFEMDTGVEGEQYLCEICSQVFPTAKVFQQHLAEHAAKKFECDVCYKSFKSSFLLKTHSRRHTGEKPFHCATCGKQFAHSSNFRTHMSIHTGDRPYKCTFCPLGFRQDPHLKHHLRTHTGEKPYSCSICAKSFAFKGNLTVHERIHTGVKPYVCPICNKGFYDSSSMKKHKWTHGGIYAEEDEDVIKYEEIVLIEEK